MKNLKNRIKLKRLEIEIKKEVDWNLGYCPSSTYFGDLLDERNKLSWIVAKEDRVWWDQYDKYREMGRPQDLMVFEV